MKKEENMRLFSDFPEISTSRWMEKIQADLKGADYQKKLIWNSDEGIAVKPFYRQEDIESLDYLEGIGNLRDLLDAPNGWTICQDISPGNKLAEANGRIKAALKGGAQAIRIDLLKARVPDLAMLEELLDGIPLQEMELHFTGCLSADSIYESLCALANQKGVKLSDLKGSLGADPLGKMAETGIAIGGFENMARLVQKVKENSPEMKVFEVRGSLIQNAGSTLVEELAYSMAMASDYMALLADKKVDPLTAQQALQLNLASGANYFMEIAKLRAARILWAKVAEAYGVETSLAHIRIHSISSEWNTTLYDPHVNMLRGTSEAMSSILGGAEMVTVLPYDHVYGNGREFSDRIARNVQIILREEAYLDRVADPASGSYYIESLTDAMAEKAWSLFCEVETMGGFMKAFAAGKIQERVEESRKKKADRAASGRDRILGTNAFPDFNELIIKQLNGNPEDVDQPDEDAAWTALRPFRLSAQFEKIRLQTEKSGKRPRVLLFKYGSPAWMTARASFSGNFFACAGYEIVDHPPFPSVEKGIEFATSKAFDILVLCSSDDAYLDSAPKVQAALGSSSLVVVAGFPSDAMDALKEAGIQHFIHMKSKLLETLTSFNNSLL